MRSGASPKRSCLLRHKSDTVDLLEAGFTVGDKPHGGLPERQRAGGTRHFLELPRWCPRDDQLAQLVVQHEQLADRFAPAEACTSALRAAASTARRAENAHQALRQ